MAQTVKNLPAMCATQVRSLSWEDPLEEAMATHSSILAWRIPMDCNTLGFAILHPLLEFAQTHIEISSSPKRVFTSQSACSLNFPGTDCLGSPHPLTSQGHLGNIVLSC